LNAAEKTMLGKYEILEELGRGGFGTVYRAADTTLGREVALKVLHPQLLVDPAFVERFLREARALAALRHPHIVTVHEVGNVEGRLFIAMELARGTDLGRAIREKGRIPWSEALAVLQPVCEALDYAHAHGTVHRDLKPGNILLDAERGPLLSDFGFARLMASSSASLSVSGGILGTPAYIAPEVWERESAQPAADMYALGCITHEMLTGQVLFPGETPVQALRAHDRGPQFPERWPEGVPAEVQSVLARALARDPGARYPTASALWHALASLEEAAKAARQVAEQRALAAQWQQETLTAMEAGQWSAARMMAGRWLAILPEDPEALAARERIERAVQAPVLESARVAEPEAPAKIEAVAAPPEKTGPAVGVSPSVEQGRPVRVPGWAWLGLGAVAVLILVLLSRRVTPPPVPMPLPEPTFTAESRLAAPVPVAPPEGSVFDYWPRTTTLEWLPVEGATVYWVEVDYFSHGENAGWASERGVPAYMIESVDQTAYTFDFVGAQPGRWRVWAVDNAGREGVKSDWWGFEYLR
jgi:hypothetical protein